MPNVSNFDASRILTFKPVLAVFEKAPGQVYNRFGPTPQPFFGLRRHRPQTGQAWPRSEFNRERFK